MQEPVHQEDYKGYIIRILPDDGGYSPRLEFDHFGTILADHPRYDLSDKKASYSELRRLALDDQGKLRKNPQAIVLTLYLYDHSGLALSTRSWVGRAHQAEWDSGCVGCIYATYDQVRREYGCKHITKAVREQATRLLEAEVEEYDKYLRGEVVGYKVVKPLDPEEGEGDELEVDSCWGFLGYDYCLEEARAVVDREVENGQSG